ncbi:MAG: hypothetical protein V1721_10030 [Pseudomonadota bacterium]
MPSFTEQTLNPAVVDIIKKIDLIQHGTDPKIMIHRFKDLKAVELANLLNAAKEAGLDTPNPVLIANNDDRSLIDKHNVQSSIRTLDDKINRVVVKVYDKNRELFDACKCVKKCVPETLKSVFKRAHYPSGRQVWGSSNSLAFPMLAALLNVDLNTQKTQEKKTNIGVLKI